MRTRLSAPLLFVVLGACSSADVVTAPIFAVNPCVGGDTLSLAENQAARVDCGNGGTTVTLAGLGVSYLIVPQFATGQATTGYIPYTIAASSAVAAAAAPPQPGASADPGGGTLPVPRPNLRQEAADRLLRSRARAAASFGMSRLRPPTGVPGFPARTPPPVGSIRTFHILSSFSATPAWKNVGAQLAYAGNAVLLYVDTLAPAGGFTAAQLQNFGQLVDQTFFPIDTTAFGPPSDVDGNGRIIFVMSPVVNADTPAATCASQGSVAGFFTEEDFNDASDPNSNQGEVFYAIVPDPNGVFSCVHSVANVGDAVLPTFMHELQHLITFSQHVIVHGGSDLSSWMDEGLSIVAEEMGSLYYEQKCPPPACRTSALQIFPDSSQGFVSNLLFDSYQYALLPDTASLTLHSDDQLGFSWRGGDWALMRWLGDQYGTGVYRKFAAGPSDGIANIELATGQSFPSLFANFGLALYTDSLPGLPRATAPAVNRFVSRNMPQLWARLFATGGPSATFPTARPVQLFPITADTSSQVMNAGTMTYYRLDTAASAATVTVQFSQPGGAAFPATLKPQMAVYRLPPGQ